MPAPAEARARRSRPAHTWSAPVDSRRDRHHPVHPRVARHVVDVGVLAHRVDLAAGRLEHRAAVNPLLQPRAVARHEPIDAAVARRHDHLGRRLDPVLDALGEIPREPRAMPRLRVHRRGAASAMAATTTSGETTRRRATVTLVVSEHFLGSPGCRSCKARLVPRPIARGSQASRATLVAAHERTT